MNQTDAYATLRTAFHAGATIQAYTVEGDDGSTPLTDVDGRGYWRDLVRLDGERPMPAFTCHPTRYRVKDHHPAEAPVAYSDEAVKADNDKAADCAALMLIGMGYAWNGAEWYFARKQPAAVEAAAIALWHRFAPDDHMEWEDETHKGEYRHVAEALLPLYLRPDPPVALDLLLKKWEDRIRYSRVAPAASTLRVRRDTIRQCMDELRAALEGSA
jgi:hypothetical protein